MLWTQCQTAWETLQSQNSQCKNSSALIQKTQLCWCVCPHAFSEQRLLETANLMVTLTFCLQRTWALRKKWAEAIAFMAQLLLLFTFFVITFFFLCRFRLRSRKTGQLYPFACSALLLEVAYCSTAFFQFWSPMCNDGFGSHTLASHPQSAEQHGGMQKLLSPCSEMGDSFSIRNTAVRQWKRVSRKLQEQVHLYLQNLQPHDLQMVAGICVHGRVCLPIINLLNQTPGVAIFPAELSPHF